MLRYRLEQQEAAEPFSFLFSNGILDRLRVIASVGTMSALPLLWFLPAGLHLPPTLKHAEYIPSKAS
jgi:hypothetical protein